jgi:hypothetical protein
VRLAARLGVRLHLPVPIVVRPGVKQRLQLATLFSNRAHGTEWQGCIKLRFSGRGQPVPGTVGLMQPCTELSVMHYGVNFYRLIYP